MDANESLRNILRAVFEGLREKEEASFSEKQEEFAFHIVECLDDFENLLMLLKKSASSNETNENAMIAREIVGFLYHVVPHLTAASRLLLDGVPDTFSPDHPRDK
jgi:hypothetical protein